MFYRNEVGRRLELYPGFPQTLEVTNLAIFNTYFSIASYDNLNCLAISRFVLFTMRCGGQNCETVCWSIQQNVSLTIKTWELAGLIPVIFSLKETCDAAILKWVRPESTGARRLLAKTQWPHWLLSRYDFHVPTTDIIIIIRIKWSIILLCLWLCRS